MENNKIIFNLSLGRLPSEDERDKSFQIRNAVTESDRTYRYWSASGWWGNQMQEPHCVGFAWTHWLEDGPVTQIGTAPIVSPTVIYFEAQQLDEFPGENYDGTSVRAGAKVLSNRGFISSYLWAWDLHTLIDSVLTLGPVVIGSNWYTDMFYPDLNGLIKIGGNIAGGHAYVINGVNINTRRFRIKNSWGRDWGKKGHAYISFDDVERLIKEDGEVCLGVEIKK